MILFKFAERGVPKEAQNVVLGHRWVFNVGWFQNGGYIGFADQYRSASDGQWKLGGQYYEATLTKHFALGSDHMWYDGPHCSFSLGFIHLNWTGANCKKCLDA